MAVHTLKTWPFYFEDILSGAKKFEIRNDDRNFQLGDQLTLVEWDRERDQATGRRLEAYVTYKVNGGQFGIQSDFCVLGIQVTGV